MQMLALSLQSSKLHDTAALLSETARMKVGGKKNDMDFCLQLSSRFLNWSRREKQ